jgi:hypothetical protein
MRQRASTNTLDKAANSGRALAVAFLKHHGILRSSIEVQ